MKYRTRTYYTHAQKALMWERWKQGWTLHQIAQLFNRAHTSVQGILSRTGGIRPLARSRTAPTSTASRSSRAGSARTARRRSASSTWRFLADARSAPMAAARLPWATRWTWRTRATPTPSALRCAATRVGLARGALCHRQRVGVLADSAGGGSLRNVCCTVRPVVADVIFSLV